MLKGLYALRCNTGFFMPRRLTFGNYCQRLSSTQPAVSSSEPQSEPVDVLRARLLYQSKKRGILENDIIIGGFANKHLAELTEDELHTYDKIINGNHMEWDLYYYCVGRKEMPPELENCKLFGKIRKFANSASQSQNLSRKRLLIADDVVSELVASFMKYRSAYLHDVFSEDVLLEDKKYFKEIKGLINLQFHVTKMNVYFRYKSPFNRMQVIGSSISEADNRLNVLYRFETLKSNIITTYNPIFFFFKRNENMRLLEGSLDLYLNDDGLISRVVHRDITVQDIEAAQAHSKMKQESEEEFRKRFEEKPRKVGDVFDLKKLFQRPNNRRDKKLMLTEKAK